LLTFLQYLFFKNNSTILLRKIVTLKFISKTLFPPNVLKTNPVIDRINKIESPDKVEALRQSPLFTSLPQEALEK